MNKPKKAMSRFALSRRTLLRGSMGGALVALGLPTLDAMLDGNGEALADGSDLPRYFMTWFFGNGVRLNRWIPEGQGQGSAWQLSEELQPLAETKEYLNILTGFDINASYPRLRGHHDGVAGFFSGYPLIELPHAEGSFSSKFGGPSIDQAIVQRLAAAGTNTYLPSLHVGNSKRLTTGEGPTLHHIAHKGPDESLASVTSPQEVYDLLFGNFVQPDDPSAPLRVKMLDLVAADAKRLKTRLGRTDQIRLDAHLENIKQLQSQIEALPPACTKPTEPGQENKDVDGNEPLEEINAVMADLVAFAFQCDQTRVATWQQSGSVGGTVYWMTGTQTNEHSLSHEDGGQELIHQAVLFNMTCFNTLLKRLRDTPVGTSNLLEQSCILLGSDASEGQSHDIYDQPIIVAGRGGGVLKTDQHIRTDRRNTSDILLSCAQVMDPTTSEVGGGPGKSTTPFEGIFA